MRLRRVFRRGDFVHRHRLYRQKLQWYINDSVDALLTVYYSEDESTCCAATWLDLEALVPAALWGMTNNHAPDVFHFREEGHVSLGRAIDDALASGGF